MEIMDVIDYHICPNDNIISNKFAQINALEIPKCNLSVTSVDNFQYVLKIAARYHIMIKLQYDTR